LAKKVKKQKKIKKKCAKKFEKIKRFCIFSQENYLGELNKCRPLVKCREFFLQGGGHLFTSFGRRKISQIRYERKDEKLKTSSKTKKILFFDQKTFLD
tara:strand:- start:169 stop:462 length:294 start_codon:yes stop_codon:yes gene_type:complete